MPARSPALRLIALAGIGTLAAFQWGSLIADPPMLRLLGVVAVAVAAGWAMVRLAARRSRLVPITVIVAAAVAMLLVLGVPARELVPWGWDDLTKNLNAGLDGLGGEFEYPLAGGDQWSRLLLVMAIVPLLLAAAALAFRPGRRGDGPPLAALLTLVAAFAVPATVRPTAAPILWGVALLPWVTVWIWGARVRRLPAVALIVGVVAIAIPVTTTAASDDPAIDYRAWTLPAPVGGIGFDWSHTYGPIDWPRTGAPLFRVRSDQPRYWRAEVLDEFYATAWRRSGAGGGPVPAEPARYADIRERAWSQRAAFTILALDSPLLISPGRPLAVDGVNGAVRDSDGTVHTDAEPLTEGTRYSVTAYAPDPGAARMRAESRRYPRTLSPYTSLAVPYDADLESTLAPARIDVRPWGGEGTDRISDRVLANSGYGRVADLAERLAAGKKSAYDVVRAMEHYLQTQYRYDEQPPERQLPLRAFLFHDRIGYCQQFSGAMALMLRMVGIPSRVAVGFAPGKRVSADSDTFEVTDFDAHSWVEVYFNDVGWVPFDPTPAAAPAQSQAGGIGVESAALGAGALLPENGPPKADPKNDETDSGPGSLDSAGEIGGGDGSLIPMGVVVLALAAVAISVAGRAARHRMLPSAVAAERELEELRGALLRSGRRRDGADTLLKIENRLSAGGLRAVGIYVGRLRELRYARPGAEPPTLGQRRAARRDLAAGRGPLGALRMLFAMPPGGPRAVRRSRRS